jgi:hypothetical protein
MNALVIEGVLITDLPAAWQTRLARPAGTVVTVRIEESTDAQSLPESAESAVVDNTLFGMWRDRKDMADVAGYVRSVRASRSGNDESQDKG